MLKRIIKLLRSNEGSILVEVLTGLVIFSIVSIGFATMLVQANTLFVRANVVSEEWERLFVKMEEQKYSPDYVDGTAFRVVLKLEDMKESDIILEDGKALGSDLNVVSMGGITPYQDNLIGERKFTKYEEAVNRMASPHNGKAYIYMLREK